MPDQDDADWRAKALKAINEKIPNGGNCTRCGQGDVVLGNQIVTPLLWKNGGVKLGSGAYPQAMTICKNCGHTSYFNLMVLGVIDGGVQESDGDGSK